MSFLILIDGGNILIYNVLDKVLFWEVLWLSIEIVEESNTLRPSGEFLPPVVSTVRNLGRSALGIIASAVFVLFSLGILYFDLLAGIIFLPIGILLLISQAVGFKRSKELYGGYGLGFKKAAFIISAVIFAAVALLDEFKLTNELLWKAHELLDGVTDIIPKPLNEYANTVFSGTDTVAACLAVGCLCLGLSFGSLSRSKHKNLPFTKTVFLSSLVNLLLAFVLVFKGLRALNLVIPCRCPIDPKVAYPTAGLYFAFAVVMLLFAVYLFVVYIRMRKVKNAVLKA